MDVAKLRKPAAIFKVMGDPVRISILLHLAVAECNVTGLCEAAEKRQQAVSHHLTIMKLEGVVEMSRRGKSNYYRLTELGQELAATAQRRLAQPA